MAENNPRAMTSHQTVQTDQTRDDDGALDTQSEASSAIGLQMSMMENRFENEITKLATMIQTMVGSLQSTIKSMSEQIEKKFAEIDQRLDSLASNSDVYANQNANRSSTLFEGLNNGKSNSDGVTQGTSSYQCKGDNPPSLITPSGQNTSIDLTYVQNKGSNSSGNIVHLSQSCPNSTIDKSHNLSTQTKGNNNHFKMRPQNYDGSSDFEEFLCQFEITCEINAWKYKEKSLYLANCLTGVARSLLNELDSDGRRDYDTLIVKLRNRFGSVYQSEIYRTQLKSRTRNKGETIQELAQAIKKLVRQAYPRVNKEVIETLSLDNFIDAITDSDIRMRVRELSPKSLDEAEQICVRLEAYKIADTQRTCFVGRLGTQTELRENEQGKSPSQFEILSDAIASLSNEVKQLNQKNTRKSDNQRFQRNNQKVDRHQRYINGRSMNQRHAKRNQRCKNRHRSYFNGNERCNNMHQRYNHRNPSFNNGNQRYMYTNRRQRLDRSYRNNCTKFADNGEQNFAYNYRGSNYAESNYSNNNIQFSLNSQNPENQCLGSSTYLSNGSNQGFSSTQLENMSSGNLNQSGWRAATRQQ